MTVHKRLPAVLGVCCFLLMGGKTSLSQDNSAGPGVQVHMVITDGKLRLEEDQPPLQLDDLKIDVGKKATKATQLLPAQGDSAALQLMIMIDDTLDPTVGGNMQELKDFVAAQPATASIAVTYMSNAGFQLAQDFTSDKDAVVKAIRLPRGTTSAMDSPYLSLIALTKGWTPQKVRRVVLMITDGIDRLRGEKPEPSRLGPGFGAQPVYHSMPTISTDADSASLAAQKTNLVVYALYAVGVGRAARSGWDLQLGLSGLTKIADETGGEVFSLGTSQLVSFTPHLERFGKLLGNQYYLVFAAEGGKKAGFQRVKIKTETKNSEILAPDNVWVPAVPQ